MVTKSEEAELVFCFSAACALFEPSSQPVKLMTVKSAQAMERRSFVLALIGAVKGTGMSDKAKLGMIVSPGKYVMRKRNLF
jgi:hypothetical protein